tara:strand:+ start:20934 stop:21299 length:366 start_codon:yes stop_codon:yes gene_type:complete
MSSTIKEIGIAGLLAVLVALLTYANKAWMPDMATMLFLLSTVAVFGVFTVYVWKEQKGDEREQFIRTLGSRISFLATGSVLLVGITIETLTNYMPSPWLGIALVTLVIAKLVGQAYGNKKY